MKQLMLLRHAKSSWKDSSLDDIDRPLNKRGKKDAPRMGELIASEGWEPDLIISSPARRAVMTAELVGENCGYSRDILIEDSLYFSGMEAYIRVIQKQSDYIDRIMLVGHNPDIEELYGELSGDYIHYPTCCLSIMEFELEGWRNFRLNSPCSLLELWAPKDVFTE